MADATEEVKETVSPNGENGSRLAGVAKNNVTPLLVTAAAATAAGLAATKGPEIMRKLSGKVDSQAQELGGKAAEGAKEQILGGSGGGGGGVLGTVGKAASKLLPGGGGGGGQKGGKTRRLPIQRWTDVAVPVDKAYEAWTQWEEWPKFMHRVLEVKPSEDDDEDGEKIHYREKIWFWTREWDGEITDQRKNDRIAWKTVSGLQHSGVVSFHKLDDNLTRVMVDMDFLPNGIFEKMASGMRFVKRALQADLARFKAYVEFGDAEGIEYKSSPAEMEQNQGDEDDSNGDEQDEQQEEQQAGGDADEQQSQADDSSDDEERENERQERESRREERRKALTGS